MFKITMMLLMTFFLSGCRSVERRITCAQIKNHQVPQNMFCDVSFKFNRCRCRQFDMNEWEAVGDPIDYPIEECEGIAGYFLEDIARDVRPNVKALANLRRNMCGE
jgi:hypothetical protein